MDNHIFVFLLARRKTLFNELYCDAVERPDTGTYAWYSLRGTRNLKVLKEICCVRTYMSTCGNKEES